MYHLLANITDGRWIWKSMDTCDILKCTVKCSLPTRDKKLVVYEKGRKIETPGEFLINHYKEEAKEYFVKIWVCLEKFDYIWKEDIAKLSETQRDAVEAARESAWYQDYGQQESASDTAQKNSPEESSSVTSSFVLENENKRKQSRDFKQQVCAEGSQVQGQQQGHEASQNTSDTTETCPPEKVASSSTSTNDTSSFVTKNKSCDIKEQKNIAAGSIQEQKQGHEATQNTSDTTHQASSPSCTSPCDTSSFVVENESGDIKQQKNIAAGLIQEQQKGQEGQKNTSGTTHQTSSSENIPSSSTSTNDTSSFALENESQDIKVQQTITAGSQFQEKHQASLNTGDSTPTSLHQDIPSSSSSTFLQDNENEETIFV